MGRVQALCLLASVGIVLAVPRPLLSLLQVAESTSSSDEKGSLNLADSISVSVGTWWNASASEAAANLQCGTRGCDAAAMHGVLLAGVAPCSNCSSLQYTAKTCGAQRNTQCSLRGAVGAISSIDHHDTTGRVSVASLPFKFQNPVIFTQPPTYNGGNPCVTRVQKLTDTSSTLTGYKMWLAESGTRDVWHTTEQSSYLILEKGETADYVIDTVDLAGSQNFQTITLSKDLGPRPWVFRMIQTTNNGADPEMSTTNRPSGLRGYVKTRMTLSENSASKFKLLLETDERNRLAATQETIGYLAMRSGCVGTQTAGDNSDFAAICSTKYGEISIGGVTYDYALGFHDSVQGTLGVRAVSFGRPFAQVVTVLADMQTFRGGNPAEVRTQDVSKSEFRFLIEEDQSADTEQWHMREVVAWLAIGHFVEITDSPTESAKGTVGLISSIDHHDTSAGRVSLTGLSFAQPVIFTQAPTYNGGDPCVVRVQQQVESNAITGYKMWLAESGVRDVWHTTEQSGYLVLEKGAGESFIVDTVDLSGSQGFQTITLSKDLGKRPWVFRMIQTTNNGADPNMSTTDRPSNLRGYVKTRMSLSGNSATTFRLFLETDERDHDAATQETVGYLAIDSGCSATQTEGDNSDLSAVCSRRSGQLVLGGVTYDYELGFEDSVQGTKGVRTVSFARTFNSTPLVLTDMQTFRGNNPAEIRTKEVTTSQFSFLIEEDQSVDSEQWHMREIVAWIALAKAQ